MVSGLQSAAWRLRMKSSKATNSVLIPTPSPLPDSNEVLTRARFTRRQGGGYNPPHGEVLELADRRDLGSRAARREGSSPSFPTAGRRNRGRATLDAGSPVRVGLQTTTQSASRGTSVEGRDTGARGPSGAADGRSRRGRNPGGKGVGGSPAWPQ